MHKGSKAKGWIATRGRENVVLHPSRVVGSCRHCRERVHLACCAANFCMNAALHTVRTGGIAKGSRAAKQGWHADGLGTAWDSCCLCTVHDGMQPGHVQAWSHAWPAMPCPAMACHTLPCHAMPCQACLMPCHAMPQPCRHPIPQPLPHAMPRRSPSLLTAAARRPAAWSCRWRRACRPRCGGPSAGSAGGREQGGWDAMEQQTLSRAACAGVHA